MADQTPQPLSRTDLPEIIARYRSGESMLEIAKDSPVSSRSFYNWIIADQGANYEVIQTECLISRVADADMKIETATDMLQVARAREMARFSRMDLERRRPHLYGPKTEVKQDTQITVIVQRQMQAEAQAPASLDQLQAPTDQKPSDILDLAPHVG